MRRVISKTGYHDSYGEEEDLELGINNLVYSMAKKEEVTTLLEFVQPSCLHKRLKKNKLISHDLQLCTQYHFPNNQVIIDVENNVMEFQDNLL